MEKDLGSQAVSLGGSRPRLAKAACGSAAFPAPPHTVVPRGRRPGTGLIRETDDCLARRLNNEGAFAHTCEHGGVRTSDHGTEAIGMLMGRTKEAGALEDVLAAVR